MNKRYTAITIMLIIAASALTVTTLAAITLNKPVAISGKISTSANIGVYADSECTTSLSSIDWGYLSQGSSTSKTIYIKNTGTDATLTLSMTTVNWNPTAANGPLAITWDKEGTTIAPGATATAHITLTAAPVVTGFTDFNAQMNIIATA